MGLARPFFLFALCPAFLIVGGCSSTVPDPADRPDVPEGKALLIAYDPGSMMLAGEWHVELNGRDYRQYGGMDGAEYFMFELWPGRHTGYLRRAGRADFFELEIEPWDIGNIYLWRAFDNITQPSQLRWPSHGGEIQGMTLIKRVGAREASPEHSISTAHGRAKYYGPTNTRGQPIMSGTLEWRDGRRMEATFQDYSADPNANTSIVYESTDYEPSASGVLEYPDGRRFVGDVLAEETEGILYDSEGNVIFSGTFREGRPDGWGYAGSYDSDEPESVYYADGYSSNDPIHHAAVQSVDERLRPPENEPTSQEEYLQSSASRIREEMSEIRTTYRDMSDRCTCSTPICWTRGGSIDESEEERRLREAQQERREQTCEEWREGDITTEEELNSRLNALQNQYDREMRTLRNRQRARERAYQQERTEYQRRYQRELAAEQARIAQERERAMEAQQQDCQANEEASYTCGCAAFVSHAETDSPPTCGR